MAQFQEKNNPGQEHKKNTKSAQKKAQTERMSAMMKREQEVLDQMLREQGIDIDALDNEYGNELDSAFEKSDSINVDVDDLEEEVVEIIETPKQH
jgi:hypothetical protein